VPAEIFSWNILLQPAFFRASSEIHLPTDPKLGSSQLADEQAFPCGVYHRRGHAIQTVALEDSLGLRMSPQLEVAREPHTAEKDTCDG
jgi:hypothetical protein